MYPIERQYLKGKRTPKQTQKPALGVVLHLLVGAVALEDPGVGMVGRGAGGIEQLFCEHKSDINSGVFLNQFSFIRGGED